MFDIGFDDNEDDDCSEETISYDGDEAICNLNDNTSDDSNDRELSEV